MCGLLFARFATTRPLLWTSTFLRATVDELFANATPPLWISTSLRVTVVEPARGISISLRATLAAETSEPDPIMNSKQ
jgi:hypothetical protein